MTEVATLGTATALGWRHCLYCLGATFKAPNDFLRHVRENHCSKEGGSFVCRYGYNGVCSSLPLEGVSDQDYEDHVIKHHAFVSASQGSSSIMAKSDKNEEKWGVYSATQNVPAVLNDPRKGMKRDFFTKTWGESFVEIRDIPPHVALPQVTTKHVESYVRRLRKRQKLLARLSQLEASKAQAHDDVDILQSSRDQLANTRDAIPPLFLSTSFNLEDPETFYAVFSHVDSSGVHNKSAKVLQEKLFHYLETVEIDMSKQISRKSSAFFETMTYLNAQMEQLRLNHAAVSTLRQGITKLREEAVIEPLKILQLPRRRANILATCKKLELMSAVKEVQGTIQVMLARQEFTSALDLISTTQDLLLSELTPIRSLKHLSSELGEHEKLIDKMVQADFIKYITEDLNRPLQDEQPLLEEDRLIAVVFGVLRLQRFEFIDNLREEVYTAIKATVKQAVVEAISQVEIDQETASVADQARVLSLSSWLGLLASVTHKLINVLQRVKIMMEVMIQAADACSGKANPAGDGMQAASLVSMSSSGGDVMLGEMEYNRVVMGIKEVLCASCDYAHDRCAKLLHARSRDFGLDKMTAKEFIGLSKTIEAFVVDTEKICGRKSTSFRMGLQGQATRFVARFHEERDARLKLNLSSERWKAMTVPPDVQRLFNHITASDSLQSPPEVLDTNHEHCNGNSAMNGPSSTNTTNANKTTTTTASEGVIVGDEEYVVVGVCVVVVRLVVEYAECASTLPLAAQQLLTRLTDLLRKFNSDTCRLLIEAGAVALGLKTITIRNLALAWRSLELLLTLLPRLSKHFCLLLRPALVTKNIDQVIKEYKEHCSAVENKIIGVMGDTLERHLSTWEARSPVPSAAFNGVLRAISKLHEAVQGVLPQSQVHKLFEKVTSVLKEKLRNNMVRLNVSSVGPQSWVVTSELTFYFNHLETLGLGGIVTQEEFTKGLWPPR
ncbi:VPS54 subunit of GARP complex scat [Oratosquilla oratoria]|uniref:VPS54 subunit of GARP complex scat n=1 Tax=Oratosquilla oratoria TaxID=337810 RepID=UPI003F75DAE1